MNNTNGRSNSNRILPKPALIGVSRWPDRESWTRRLDNTSEHFKSSRITPMPTLIWASRCPGRGIYGKPFNISSGRSRSNRILSRLTTTWDLCWRNRESLLKPRRNSSRPWIWPWPKTTLNWLRPSVPGLIPVHRLHRSLNHLDSSNRLRQRHLAAGMMPVAQIHPGAIESL